MYCALMAVAWVFGLPAGARAQEAVARIEIGQGEIGAAPAAFAFSPRQDSQHGSWTVVRDPTAGTGVAIEQAGLAADAEPSALAVYKPVSVKNAEISLRVNAAGGISDQGGGVAVRLSDPRNYYLVQLDALRDRVLLTCVRDGASEEIAAVDADIASHTWHTLTVRAKDDEFFVSLDGTWVFTGFDKTLSQPGRIALWTKGDSLTRFDSVAITPLPTAEERY
jgi:hypothetical protein